MPGPSNYVEFLIRLADDHLILGHRLSEWCGHAPTLEEDLAMPNMALDLIGQARVLYSEAGEAEGLGRDEDALAYLRRENEYRNVLLAEQPNQDFAHTMLRHFYFSVYMDLFWAECLTSQDEFIRSVAARASKEIAYHVRHCGEWIVRLGDGTAESHRKMQNAVDSLHPYTDELFLEDPVTEEAVSRRFVPAPGDLKDRWQEKVRIIFEKANLDYPAEYWPQGGGRRGRHGEEMGYILAELQFVQRAYPGMKW